MPTMDEMWNTKVTEEEILKKLIKYKNKWYNHVTYLWWEPFIQKNFNFALKVWKKLWFTIMVTTNASMLQFENISSKYLKYIDELIISIPIVNKRLQKKINNINSIINFDNVFVNIKKYWKWNLLKVNTVITPENIDYIDEVVDLLNKYNIKELSFTYPDIDIWYYKKKYIIKHISLPYDEYIQRIEPSFKKALLSGIRVKLTDVPFCFLPNKNWIKYTDDFDYDSRTKLTYNWEEFNRQSSIERSNCEDVIDSKNLKKLESMNSRMRRYIWECNKCRYIWKCWGIWLFYKDIYWIKQIKAIN